MRNQNTGRRSGDRKLKKGDAGYHRMQTLQTGIAAGAMLAAALIMYFTALAYFKTNQNLFTIMAVLIILPAARIFVKLVMLLRAGECSADLAEEIGQHVGKLQNAYDMYFTSEKKNFNICHMAVGGKSVAAYTQDPKCDTAAGERHLQKMMRENGIHGYQVKIFTGLGAYLTRLDQLQELESEAGANHEKLWILLNQISL